MAYHGRSCANIKQFLEDLEEFVGRIIELDFTIEVERDRLIICYGVWIACG